MEIIPSVILKATTIMTIITTTIKMIVITMPMITIIIVVNLIIIIMQIMVITIKPIRTDDNNCNNKNEHKMIMIISTTVI